MSKATNPNGEDGKPKIETILPCESQRGDVYVGMEPRDLDGGKLQLVLGHLVAKYGRNVTISR